MDIFGDGWDTAQLHVYNSYGYYRSYSPTIQRNPTYASYCFDTTHNVNGDTVTMAVQGYRPSQTWEVSRNVQLTRILQPCQKFPLSFFEYSHVSFHVFRYIGGLTMCPQMLCMPEDT